jgi:UDP-N-acetylglucosamine 2-epimerase (non-hydrolysing)/GDP/UDP-N,N'-diacetylbacillosamine 2-epimerase (hydrolysing)
MTGTRADYPRVKSVLREILRRKELELFLIVTGTHLLPEYGNTVGEIEADGVPIYARVPMYSDDDTPYGMAKAAARCSDGIADVLNDIDPDIFLITVDRVETLATAQSVLLMNHVMAHIQGGEVTGTVDESIRHAVTKMAQIHFPATPDAGERIVRMGEDPAHVHVTGCPYIDIIMSMEYRSRDELAGSYGFDPARPLVLFTQHPVTTEFGRGTEQMRTTIKALERFQDFEVIALYSNVDAGGRDIVAEMKKNDRFRIFPNIDSRDFLAIMKNADLMIGNSSAGIREAPSFRLPVINIGSRQAGRLRAANVIDVDHDVEAIALAIEEATDPSFRTGMKDMVNPYGDGKASARIVDVLAAVELTDELLQKRITY